jgi:hypothetical protein
MWDIVVHAPEERLCQQDLRNVEYKISGRHSHQGIVIQSETLCGTLEYILRWTDCISNIYELSISRYLDFTVIEAILMFFRTFRGRFRCFLQMIAGATGYCFSSFCCC